MLKAVAMKKPHLIIISGPNGAGKSTTAPALLQGTLGVTEFVNADVIAQGLSAFNPERAAFHAGRIMLERLQQLADEHGNFAFETTLASRTFAHWIKELKNAGYAFHLFFLWLPAAEFAIARVAERVKMGGHNVPEDAITRRYHAGLKTSSTSTSRLPTHGTSTTTHKARNRCCWPQAKNRLEQL